LSYSSKNGSEIVMGSCKLGKCFINVNVVEIDKTLAEFA